MNYLELEKHDGIATVWLNRPDKKNAMSFALLRELVSTAHSLRRDRSLRAVILAGRGQTFSAGIDLTDLNTPKNAAFALWTLIRPGRSLFQQACLIWRDLPVPVIAVLEGHCLGAGLQLALAADFRIVTPDCRLAIMESRWGLVPDMGITQTLRGLMPLDKAKELTMTARLLSGEEALALHLVTQVSTEPMQQALSLAQAIAQRSPDAILAAKRVINGMTGQPASALSLEKRWQRRLSLGRNRKIAIRRDKQPALTYQPRQFD